VSPAPPDLRPALAAVRAGLGEAALAAAAGEALADLGPGRRALLLDGARGEAPARAQLADHALEALLSERLVARLGGPGWGPALTGGRPDPAAALADRLPAAARRRARSAADRALADLPCHALADPDRVERLFPSAAPARATKRRGGVYTRADLVALVLDLVGWDGRGALLEPAAGAGAFLLAAWRRALAAGDDPTAASRRLGAVDVHPLAARAGRTALALEAIRRGLGPGDVPGLVEADALAEGGDAPTARLGDWDAVVGNPPWVRGERIPPARRARYRGRYPDLGAGNVDLAAYFVRRALDWLRPGGRLGLVLSQGLLGARSAAGLRTLLAERTVEALASFEWAEGLFPGANVIPCVLVVRNAPPPPTHRVALASAAPGASRLRWSRVAQASWLGLARGGRWPVGVAGGGVGLLRRLGAAPRALAAGYGLAVRTRVRPGELIGDAATAERFRTPRPLLDGREVRAWSLDWSGRFIDYRPERISDPKTPAFFAGPKVLVPRIALTPQAAVDDGPPGPFYCRNTVMVVRAPGTALDAEPHALAALINSLPVRVYAHRVLRAGVLAGSHRATFYAGAINDFPVPAALRDDPAAAARLAWLGRRARDRAEAGDRRGLARVVGQVDAAVAEAFGLTPAQLEALRARAAHEPLATILRPVAAGRPIRRIAVQDYAAGERYA